MAQQLLHRFGREARNAESRVQTENLKRTMREGRILGRGKREGGAIQPLSQERRHGGGKPGRAAVNGSPGSGGMHSLIGVIDTARLAWT